MTEQSVNIPQVLVFIVVTFLAVRWYFSKPTGSAARPTANASGARLNYAQVDQLAQMFPQLSRRDIGWDLQRNGGNIGATTERVLSGRELDAAPAHFQLPAPRRSNTTQAPSASPARKPAHPDLITRYNLSSKLNQDAAEPPAEESPKPKAWSQDRNERQSNMQRRREEMILAARRKMEEKEREKAKNASVAP